MTHDSPSTPRRALRLVGAMLAMVAITLAALSSGNPASADTGFAGSTPSGGDVVTDPVTLVTLAFTASAEPVGEGFVVLDARGEVRAPTAVTTLDDKVYTLRFDPPLAGGEIGVRWSVIGGDGHPLDGSFSFTVTAPSPTDVTAATVSAPTVVVGTPVAADPDMSQMSSADMASMDDFLAVDAARPGESLATLGRVISFAGIALALGGIAFAATTLRGEMREIRSLVIAIRFIGGVLAVGAVIEYAGIVRIADGSLTGFWTSSTGFATLLRMFAGIAIAGGLRSTTVALRRSSAPQPLSSAPNTTAARDESGAFWESGSDSGRRPHRNVEAEPIRRWVGDRSSAVAFGGSVVAVVSFWFDGHTVSKGLRPLHAIANSVHVVAGSVWMGGVVAMAAIMWTRHRRGVPSRALELVMRFSSVASVALGAVLVAGLVMAVSILDSFGELTGTQWGKVLLLKTAAAGLALVGGAYNHVRLLPALEADPGDPLLHQRVRSVVTAEAIMLSFVVVVTAWLVASAT